MLADCHHAASPTGVSPIISRQLSFIRVTSRKFSEFTTTGIAVATLRYSKRHHRPAFSCTDNRNLEKIRSFFQKPSLKYAARLNSSGNSVLMGLVLVRRDFCV